MSTIVRLSFDSAGAVVDTGEVTAAAAVQNPPSLTGTATPVALPEPVAAPGFAAPLTDGWLPDGRLTLDGIGAAAAFGECALDVVVTALTATRPGTVVSGPGIPISLSFDADPTGPVRATATVRTATGTATLVALLPLVAPDEAVAVGVWVAGTEAVLAVGGTALARRRMTAPVASTAGAVSIGARADATGDAATEATIVAVTITDHLDTAAEAELARAAADGLGEIDSLVDSGAEGAAGAATGDEMRTGGVRWRTFETATAYWSASTGAHLVHARIGAVYTARGGALGRLGLPTSAESGVTDLLDRFRAKPRGRSGLTGWDVLRPTGTLAGSATVLDATDAALHSAVRPRVSDLRRGTASPTTPTTPAGPAAPTTPAGPVAPADTPVSPVLRGHLSSDLGVRQVRDLTHHQDVPSVAGLAESLRRGEIGAVEASLTRPNVFLRNDALTAAVTALRPDTRAEALPLADLDTTPDGAGGALARLVSDSERLGADLAVAVGNVGYIVSGPRAQLFQHGIVIVTANAAVELFDEIFAHWLLLGGTRGFLGAPQGSQIDIVGGAYADFGGGRIYWSARTGAHEVHGAILGRYFNVDGTDRALGFPTSDELPINGYPTARMSTFERGIIFWTPEGGARILTGDFLAAWTAAGGVSHYGLPTGEAQTTTRDGIEYRWQVFERGVLLWTEALGCVDQFTVRIARVATGNIDDGYELSGPIPRDDTTAELIVRAWVWVDGAEVLHRESGHGGSSMDLDGCSSARAGSCASPPTSRVPPSTPSRRSSSRAPGRACGSSARARRASPTSRSTCARAERWVPREIRARHSRGAPASARPVGRCASASATGRPRRCGGWRGSPASVCSTPSRCRRPSSC